VAAGLFVAGAGLTGLTLSRLISIASWRKAILTAAVVFTGAIALFAGDDPKKLLQFSKFLPSALVARAAAGDGRGMAIVILAALCAVTYSAALWSLRLSLENTESRNAARNSPLVPLAFPAGLAVWSQKTSDTFAGCWMSTSDCRRRWLVVCIW